MVLIYGVVAWLVLVPIAVTNGVFRGLVLVPRLGETAGRAVSTTMLCAMVVVIAVVFVLTAGEEASTGTLALVGVMWVAFTLVFEFGLGRLQGMSWEALLADYDVRRGRLWVLVPLTELIAPPLAGAAAA